jgi:hypothetical protein
MWYHVWDYHFGAVVVDIEKKLLQTGESLHRPMSYMFPEELELWVSLSFLQRSSVKWYHMVLNGSLSG